MKETIKNALILFVITLVAGALLGIVYEVTKEPIRVQKALAEQKANQDAYPEATEFKDFSGFDAAETAALLAGDPNFSRVSIDGVKVAEKNGTPDGYAIQITSMGYGDNITWTLGLTNDGLVNGISIISINETPGLGMNANKVLVPQFDDVDIPDDLTFDVTKTADNVPETVDAISGATITTTAITNGVNAGLLYYDTYLKGGAQ
ncbi:MAG: FMN-binding protein [Lachnospiraceae bacterium]|nr:FMN-binding protein [Lachnospiraceae bacterium]